MKSRLFDCFRCKSLSNPVQNLLLLLILWGLWYLAFATRTIVAPLLPLIANELAINHTMAGGLYLFAGVGATIASLLAGFLAIRIGIKRLIILSFLMIACTAVGIFFARSYFMLAGLLFILGLSGGFYLPCAIPMLTSIFQPGNWGKAISVHETAAGFSFLSVPFIVAYTLDFLEWRLLFIIFAGTVTMAILAFWSLAPNPQANRGKRANLQAILKRTDFWIILALWVNCGMTSMGVYSIIPLYLVDEKAMEIDFANKILGFSRIGGFIGQVVIGFFLDRFSTKKIMFCLVLASGISTLGLALIDSQWLFLSLLLLQGTFSVVFFPVGIMAISQLADFNERGVYAGTIMAVSQMMGIGLTPFMLGAIADIWSFRTGLILLGILTLCHCPILKFLKRI